MTDQPELPGMPPPLELPPTPPGWSVRKLSTDRLCGRCVIDVLHRGAAVAPHPMPARYQINAKTAVTERLCTPHAIEKLEGKGGRRRRRRHP